MPTWIVAYFSLWMVCIGFIFFRHHYLVPQRLTSYFSERTSSEYHSVQERQQNLEGGVLGLCAILGMGLSDYLDYLLLFVSIFLMVRGFAERRTGSKFGSLERMAHEYHKQENQFWTRFAQAPRRFMGAFFIFAFLYFLNLPSLNPYSSQELIVILLMSSAFALLGLAIRDKWSVKRTKSVITVILSFLLVFTVVNGDPLLQSGFCQK